MNVTLWPTVKSSPAFNPLAGMPGSPHVITVSREVRQVTHIRKETNRKKLKYTKSAGMKVQAISNMI